VQYDADSIATTPAPISLPAGTLPTPTTTAPQPPPPTANAPHFPPGSSWPSKSSSSLPVLPLSMPSSLQQPLPDFDISLGEYLKPIIKKASTEHASESVVSGLQVKPLMSQSASVSSGTAVPDATSSSGVVPSVATSFLVLSSDVGSAAAATSVAPSITSSSTTTTTVPEVAAAFITQSQAAVDPEVVASAIMESTQQVAQILAEGFD
jgi:hypothetical protein